MEIQETFYGKYIKRLLDIVLSLLVLLVFGWLYLIIILLVWMNMGNPVIFVHKRPGRIDPKTGRERIFNLYKFRSMTNEVDSNGVLLPNTERLTKFGRKIRSTSLDELPEIVNILIGDMSFVGPRPLHTKNLEYYTAEEHKRHLVRPGLTGLAQVNGRTTLTWDEKFAFDLQYVSHVTFLQDCKIVLKTVGKVLKHSDIVEAGEQENFYVYRERQWEEGLVPRPQN